MISRRGRHARTDTPKRTALQHYWRIKPMPMSGVLESVAAAVVDFFTSALVEAPHRVGKPLRRELEGIWSARRGTYRILYRMHQQPKEVVVLRIEHRRDAYRSRA